MIHSELLKQSSTINVIYYIGKLPGYGHIKEGGAQLVLQHLVEKLIVNQPKYKPEILVQHGREKNSNNTLPVTPHMHLDDLINHLRRNNHPKTILHLADSQLLLYHPEYLHVVASFWKGHIVQRLTQLDRINSLKSKIPNGLSDHLNQISMFVSQSDEITKVLTELEVSPEKITQISNGVDTNIFFPSRTSEEKNLIRQKLFPVITNDKLIYYYVGRLSSHKKRVVDLFHAWKNSKLFEDGHFLNLIGSYDEGIPEINDIKSLKKVGIILSGLVPHNLIAEYNRASDVFILPTVPEGEGFSNAILEAQACGLPIICRKGVSGSNKVVFQNQTGLFFEDVDGLTSDLVAMKNRTNRSRMAKNALNHTHSSFTLEIMAKNHFELYERLLRNN